MALFTLTPSLLSQLCAGFKTTRDVLGSQSRKSGWSNSSEIQSFFQWKGGKEGGGRAGDKPNWEFGSVVGGRWGTKRLHYSSFLKTALSQHSAPLEGICICLRPYSAEVFPAPAKSFLKLTLFFPANGIVLLKIGMSRLCSALVDRRNSHS